MFFFFPARSNSSQWFQCSTAATCIQETADHCTVLYPRCQSFAVSPHWNSGTTAQWYSTNASSGVHANSWTLYSRSGGPTPDAQRYCAYKAAALAYAQHLFNRNPRAVDWTAAVADALELALQCPNVSLPTVSTRLRPSSAMVEPGFLDQTAVVVDCLHGRLDAPGTVQDPLLTLQGGLNRTRALGSRLLLVRNGTCYLSAALVLDQRDNGLLMRPFSLAETVTLSGGILLKPNWTATSSPPGVYKASLSVEDITPPFTILFDGMNGQMLTRARFPNNADVVSRGLWSFNNTGYAPATEVTLQHAIWQTNCSKVRIASPTVPNFFYGTYYGAACDQPGFHPRC